MAPLWNELVPKRVHKLRFDTKLKDGKISEMRADSVCMDVDGEDTMEEGDSSSPCCRRLWKIWQFIYQVLSSIVGLILVLVAYSIAGALIFQAIEGEHETSYKSNITHERRTVIESVLNGSATFLNNQTHFKKHLEDLLLNYEDAVKTALKSGVSSDSTKQVWSFWGSLFFCGTIYSTIGYGHIIPATGWGQVATMIYAAFGIPLVFIVLKDVGKYFTVALKFVWGALRRYYYTGYCKKIRKPLEQFRKGSYDLDQQKSETQPDASEEEPKGKTFHGIEIDDEFNLPIVVALIILFIYIFLGAMMYSLWEEWTYLEAFYFVFISISTIGFGDIVPEHPKFFIISSIYIFIGLSLVSMVINVAIEFFSETVDKAKETVTEQVTKVAEKIGIDIEELQASSKSSLNESTGSIKEANGEVNESNKGKASPSREIKA